MAGEVKGKVLIFGISGFVGGYLTKEFLANGYAVSGSDSASAAFDTGGVSFTQANLLNAGDVLNVITSENPDMIINLAAISSVGLSWQIPADVMGVNVTGAVNILEAVRKTRPQTKILFIGSSEEYEADGCSLSETSPVNANNPYGISKTAQERFAKVYKERYNIPVYCTRSFNHTGAGQKDSFVLPSFCRQAAAIDASGKPGVIKVGNLSAARDFSDVRDVVRAYRIILEKGIPGAVYNVGSGKAYSLKELLEFIISLSGQKISVEVDPERIRPVDTPYICCDRTLITNELGWEPEFSIFDTLREMFNFYRESAK